MKFMGDDEYSPDKFKLFICFGRKYKNQIQEEFDPDDTQGKCFI